jgi:hypothetical protein
VTTPKPNAAKTSAPKPSSPQPTQPRRRPVASLRDVLKAEYLRQKGIDADSDAELHAFEPKPDAALTADLDKCVEAVQVAWNRVVLGNEVMPRLLFHQALDSFQSYLGYFGTQGLMASLQVVKLMYDRVATRRENMGKWIKRIDGDRRPLMMELYAMACLQLRLPGRPGDPAFALGRDDIDFLLAPMIDPHYQYVSDVAVRFDYVPGGHPAYQFKQTKVFLDYLLYCENELAGAELLSLDTTLRYQQFWNSIFELSKRFEQLPTARRLELATQPEVKALLMQYQQLMSIEEPVGITVFGQGMARICASPGVNASFGRITIMDIISGKQPRFIISYSALEPRLFQVGKGYIEQKLLGSRMTELYNSTVGMVYVANGLAIALPFLPVFIESGFAGLAYEIAVFWASQKIGDKVAGDYPFLSQLIALTLMVVAPRPNFRPKVFGVPNVIEVKAGPVAAAGKQIPANWLEPPASPAISAEQRALPAPAEPVPPKSASTPPAPHVGEPPRPRYQQMGHQPVGQRTTEAQARAQANPPPEQAPQPSRGGQQQQQMQQQQMQQQQTRQVTPEESGRPKAAEKPLRPEPVREKLRPESASDRAADAAAKQAEQAERRGVIARQVERGKTPAPSRTPEVDHFINKEGFRIELHGDAAALRQSRKGYQVYMWLDAKGRVLYVGRSGASLRIELLPKGASERAFNDWIARLRASHADTPWIHQAVEVRVYNQINRAEMFALEDFQIEANWGQPWNWNEQWGGFYQERDLFGLSRDGLAGEAMRSPYSRFTVSVTR